MSIYRLPLGQYSYTDMSSISHRMQPLLLAVFQRCHLTLMSSLLEKRRNNHTMTSESDVKKLLSGCYRTTSATRRMWCTSIRMCSSSYQRMVTFHKWHHCSLRNQQPSQDLYGEHLSSSFVPNAVQQHTEQETVRQSIEQRQSGSAHTLMWPTIAVTPINEFTTEGYFSMAFSTLFPWDNAKTKSPSATILSICIKTWSICKAPSLKIFCLKHKDEVACFTSRKNVHQPKSR